ncbi:hypothetical protein GCM10009539_04610 [Cryptosporangium japonicum]|uniref:DUF2244 domain-containing protein n=1 Tax=Cryptosporangium japonicum TaxID=80872 RepID=A0ABN0TIG0_9ACTN
MKPIDIVEDLTEHPLWWAARVPGRDAMPSNSTPPTAARLGIWGNIGIWIAFGAALGLLAGLLLDNVGFGVALGPGLGVAAWAVFIGSRPNTHGES